MCYTKVESYVSDAKGNHSCCYLVYEFARKVVCFFFVSSLTRNTNIGNQEKAIAFRTDDVIILQGYPKIWQDTELLNVKLAIKMPKDSANGVISRDTLSHLLVNVAPAIQGQIGHSIAYIGNTEITSVPPDASAGRKSVEEPPSMILHKSIVIALGVAVGVVLLVAVVVAVSYRRRKNRYGMIGMKKVCGCLADKVKFS